MKESKRPTKVIIERLSKLTSWQFLLGIILGSISSMLVNYYTVEYEDYKSTTTMIESLQNEMNMNIDLIKYGDEEGGEYSGQLHVEAWDAAISSGKLYSLDEATVEKLQDLYSELKWENHVRANADYHYWDVLTEASRMAGLALYYEEAISTGEIAEGEALEYAEKGIDLAIEATGTFSALETISYYEAEVTEKANSEIRSKTDDIKTALSEEAIENPLDLLVRVLSYSTGAVLLILLLTGIRRPLKRLWYRVLSSKKINNR